MVFTAYLLNLFGTDSNFGKEEGIDNMKAKLLKTFALSSFGFSFVLAAYLFLLTQTSQAWLGNIVTPIYLIQYFVLFFGVSFFQPKFFISPMIGAINALFLFLLQTNRSGGWLGWAAFIEIGIFFIALINLIVSIVFILYYFLKRKK
jgi:hypothetical protein